MNNQVTFKIKAGKLIGKLIYKAIGVFVLAGLLYAFLATTVFKDDHQTMVFIDIAMIVLGILWFVMSTRSLLRRSIVLENRTLFVKKGEQVLEEVDILDYLFDTYVYKRYYNGVPTTITYSLLLKNDAEERSVDCSFLSKGEFNTLISTIRRYQKNLVGEEQATETIGATEKAEKREIPHTVFTIAKNKIVSQIIGSIVGVSIIVGLFLVFLVPNFEVFENSNFPLILIAIGLFIVIRGVLKLMNLPTEISIDSKKINYGNKEFKFDQIDKIIANPPSKDYQQLIKIVINGKTYKLGFGSSTPENREKSVFPDYDVFCLVLEEAMHQHGKEYIVKVA